MRSEQELAQVLRKGPTEAANELFYYTASQYLPFDLNKALDASGKEAEQKFAKFNTVMATYQNNLMAAINSYVNNSTNKKIALNATMRLMEELVQLGDYHSAYTVNIAVDDLQSRARKEPELQAAFDNLKPEQKDLMKELDPTKAHIVDTYSKFKNVSVPYVGAYSAVSVLLKEAAGLTNTKDAKQTQEAADQRNKVITKIKNFADKTKKVARQNKLFLMQSAIKNHQKDIKTLEDYVARYANAGTEVDRKKHEAAKYLSAIVNNKKMSLDDKISAINNFIDQSPKTLQHKNIINVLRGSELTIVKTAKDLLSYYKKMQFEEPQNVIRSRPHSAPPLPSRENRPDLNAKNRSQSWGAVETHTNRTRAETLAAHRNRPEPQTTNAARAEQASTDKKHEPSTEKKQPGKISSLIKHFETLSEQDKMNPEEPKPTTPRRKM